MFPPCLVHFSLHFRVMEKSKFSQEFPPFYVYIWRHNLVHRKYSFDFFIRLACTYFLSKKYESVVVIRPSYSIVARPHERNCRPGKLNFPTLLAAWSRQQYPCTRVKLSFTVLISQSDKKKEYFKVYFDRSILYPDGVDSSAAFLGAIRLALIAWPPKYDNTQ